MNDGMNSGGTGATGAGGFMLGMLFGIIIGGATALMLAPRSGAETREMLRNRYGQVKEAVRSSAQDVKQNFQGMKES